MKFIEGEYPEPHYLELTRRNLETLLAKLEEESQRVLIAPGGLIAVRAVEDEEHYSDREPGPVLLGGEIV